MPPWNYDRPSGARLLALEGCIAVALLAGCGAPTDTSPPLFVDRPVHLEEHLDTATVTGSALPETVPAAFAWRFDEPQPSWRPIAGARGRPVEPERLGDALRLPLTPVQIHPSNDRLYEGYLIADLEAASGAVWNLGDWARVEIRARASSLRHIGLMFNYTETDPRYQDDVPVYSFGDQITPVGDGTVETYVLDLDSSRMRLWEGPWTHLGLWFSASVETTESALELLSVRVVPTEADFAAEPFGTLMVRRGPARDPEVPPTLRRTVFTHTPVAIRHRVRVPPSARLDVGLGVITEAPVTFSVGVETPDGEVTPLLETSWSDPGAWAQKSVDLGAFAGHTVTLELAARAERLGSVALWAAPTLSAPTARKRPNIVLYVIDGGGADYVSAYGYDRATPELERLAAAGALFERAHSNSGWTRPSTASFLTSLQHSVMGGLRNGRNPVPDRASTLAEHLHQAGYQTALFTTNANAGRISNLDRGNDWFREAGVENWSTSSTDLFRDFEAWRDAYPSEPYFVHFQTTDVHNPHDPREPFAGRYVEPERRRLAEEWTAAVEEIPETDEVGIREALELIGADQVTYWTAQRDLHDECMAHQDHQIATLVAWLEERGEWEHTLLVVASDHSVAAGSWDFSLLMRDPSPPHVYHDDRAAPQFRSGISRIPLIVVWPGRIEPGQRFVEPVSMLDLLPTLLDLVGLPQPEIKQGRSLAQLLLGEESEEPHLVFLDEFEVDPDTGELRGRIEVIDGHWGASLEIHPDSDKPPSRRRPAPLLLYDLESDPECLRSLHEEHPDLVSHYTELLEAQLEAHLALGRRFTHETEASPLTAEQLETLRSLGYIQ